jgi:hypothetical protein
MSTPEMKAAQEQFQMERGTRTPFAFLRLHRHELFDEFQAELAEGGGVTERLTENRTTAAGRLSRQA